MAAAELPTRAHATASRAQLFDLLAEAAELEHNLLCCYLYAAFSLKTDDEGGLAADELEAVRRWNGVIIGVAVEEMTHLALLANLSVALGIRPHFDRPNLPAAPLHQPAAIVVELAGFSRDTLDHFVFLERPEGTALPDAPSFAAARSDYVRGDRPGVALMPGAEEYATIGGFYQCLRDTLINAAEALGEATLFCGGSRGQIDARVVELDGLTPVTDLASALAALDTIVTQGEGSPGEQADSHFGRFTAIRDELDRLSARRPDFAPARPVARNPVMRRPVDDQKQRTHIDAPEAAALLDLANALYGFMLRLLTQAWGRGDADHAAAAPLMQAAMELMSIFGAVSRQLCMLPASRNAPGVNAGPTFAMLRATEPLVGAAEKEVLSERLAEIADGLRTISLAQPLLAAQAPCLKAIGETLAAMASARPEPAPEPAAG